MKTTGENREEQRQPETFLEFLKINAIEATREFFDPIGSLKFLWSLILSGTAYTMYRSHQNGKGPKTKKNLSGKL